MRLSLLIVFLVALALISRAQEVWEVVQISGVNTPFSEIPAFVQDRELGYFAPLERDLLHEEEWLLPGNLRPYRVSIQNGFAVTSGVPVALELHEKAAVWGGVSYCAATKDWYISYRDGGRKARNDIAVIAWSSGLLALALGPEGYSFLHPAISPGGDQLLFASDMPGGKGGFDLYISNLVGERWTTPINLSALNSEADDVFPSWWNNQIAFSSDRKGGKGGLDVYLSTDAAWKSAMLLPSPVNGPSDDFATVPAGDNLAYFASDRSEGKGSDDIWIMRRMPAAPVLADYTGRISIGNTGIRDVGIRVYNDLGVLVSSCTTDDYGKFPLEGIPYGREFVIEADAGNADLINGAIMEIADGSGKVLKRISSDGKGRFRFAMLPYEDPGALVLLDNTDESVLVINLAGKAFSDEPGDVGSGERVYLLDKEGKPESLTYTGNEGDFEFRGVDPKAKYEIAVDPGSSVKKIQMEDGEDAITIADGRATYTRLEEGEYREIRLSDGRVIQVKPGEALFVSEINYAFDSHVPDNVAKERLKSLASILIANSGLVVELRSHTDSRGSREYNQSLSERRAKTAEDFLIGCGVPAERLRSKGLGEGYLLNSCDDSRECSEEEHAVNRRTELIVLPD